MFEGLKKGWMHFSYHLFIFNFFYIQLIYLCIYLFFNFFYFIFMRISPEAGLSDITNFWAQICPQNIVD